MKFKALSTFTISLILLAVGSAQAQISGQKGEFTVIEKADGCDGDVARPGVEFARWVSPGNCNNTKYLVNERMVTYVDLIRQSIYFVIDKDNIDADDKQRMDEVINEIKNSDGVKAVRLVGYADRFNTNDYNIKLSKRRATHGLNYFKSKGFFVKDDVKFGFFGEERPVTNCPTNASIPEQVKCLQADRRVDIEVEVYRRKVDRVQDTVVYDRNGNVIETIPAPIQEPEYKGPEGVTYEPMN